VEGENILNQNQAADQNIGVDAVHELRAISSMYKGYDNRCLKPDDSKDPELWDHYDPDDFYYATSQEFTIFFYLMLNTFNTHFSFMRK